MISLLKVLAPLIQTFLWVGLIGGIIWKYHAVINDILVAIKNRIEGGSNIKAGFIEISEQLKPQNTEQQKEKIQSEIQELVSQSPKPTEEIKEKRSALQQRYFQAEDLALRAIQGKYGVTVKRQVTAGKDVGFDGYFKKNGVQYVVEVKYTYHKPSVASYRKSIEQIAKYISQYKWSNVTILFVIVVENPKDKEIYDVEIERIGLNSPFPIEIIVYDIESLEKEIGIK